MIFTYFISDVLNVHECVRYSPCYSSVSQKSSLMMGRQFVALLGKN